MKIAACKRKKKETKWREWSLSQFGNEHIADVCHRIVQQDILKQCGNDCAHSTIIGGCVCFEYGNQKDQMWSTGTNALLVENLQFLILLFEHRMYLFKTNYHTRLYCFIWIWKKLSHRCLNGKSYLYVSLVLHFTPKQGRLLCKLRITRTEEW